MTYGAATDVPDLLRTLAANDGFWPDALDELLDAVLHQDTCYSATPAAMPFLARLARSPRLSARRRTELCQALLHAATVEAEGHDHDDAYDDEADYGWTDDADEPYADHHRRTREAVAAEVTGLLARWPATMIIDGAAAAGSPAALRVLAEELFEALLADPR